MWKLEETTSRLASIPSSIISLVTYWHPLFTGRGMAEGIECQNACANVEGCGGLGEAEETNDIEAWKPAPQEGPFRQDRPVVIQTTRCSCFNTAIHVHSFGKGLLHNTLPITPCFTSDNKTAAAPPHSSLFTAFFCLSFDSSVTIVPSFIITILIYDWFRSFIVFVCI